MFFSRDVTFRQRGRRHVLLVLLLVFPTMAGGQPPQRREPDVSTALMKPGSKVVFNLMGEKLEVGFETIKLAEGSRIEHVLRGKGILPDVEATGLIYAKNPRLTSKSFVPGVEVIVPVAKGGQRFKEA